MRRISGPIAPSLALAFGLTCAVVPGLAIPASAAGAPVAPWPCVANAAASVRYADQSRISTINSGFVIQAETAVTGYDPTGQLVVRRSVPNDVKFFDYLDGSSVLYGTRVLAPLGGGGTMDLTNLMNPTELDLSTGATTAYPSYGYPLSVGRGRFVTSAGGITTGRVLGQHETDYALSVPGGTRFGFASTAIGLFQQEFQVTSDATKRQTWVWGRSGRLEITDGFDDGITDHRDFYLHDSSVLKLYDGTNLALIGVIDISSTGGTVVSYQFSGGVGRLLTSNGKLWDAVPGSSPVLLATDLPLIGATLMADEAGNMFLNEGHPDNLINPLQGRDPISIPSNQALADQVERLYRAYFLRDPDSGGFAHWRSRRAAGTSIESISSTFASSQEFQNRYGALSNAEFVNLVYQNVLHRAPEADGLAFWTGRLDAGAGRGSVMVGFSESTEYVTSTGTVEPNSSETGGVFRLYWAFLDRDPDLAGLCFWARRLESGTTLGDVADNFATSVEFIAKYGELTNAEFVALVYQNVLGRPADPDGLAFWTGRLDAGASRGSVMVGFSESAENVLRRGVLP